VGICECQKSYVCALCGAGTTGTWLQMQAVARGAGYMFARMSAVCVRAPSPMRGRCDVDVSSTPGHIMLASSFRKCFLYAGMLRCEQLKPNSALGQAQRMAVATTAAASTAAATARAACPGCWRARSTARSRAETTSRATWTLSWRPHDLARCCGSVARRARCCGSVARRARLRRWGVLAAPPGPVQAVQDRASAAAQ